MFVGVLWIFQPVFVPFAVQQPDYGNFRYRSPDFAGFGVAHLEVLAV